MTVLSKAERQFLENLKEGDLSGYSAVYRRQLKHKILNKRRALTEDLLVINALLDKLQDL
jgi:hypothetical protein